MSHAYYEYGRWVDLFGRMVKLSFEDQVSLRGHDALMEWFIKSGVEHVYD